MSKLTKPKILNKFQFLVGLLLKDAWLVVGVLLVQVLISASNAVIPYFTKLQVDTLQGKSVGQFALFDLPIANQFLLLLLIPAGIELIRLAIFNRLNTRLQFNVINRLQFSTENLIWKKLRELDGGFFDNQRNQAILSSALSSANLTRDFFNFVRSRLGNLTSLVTILPLLGLIDRNLLILVSVITLMQLLLGEVLRKSNMAHEALSDKIHERYWQTYHILSQDFQMLRILGNVDRFLTEYQDLNIQRKKADLQRDLNTDFFRNLDWILSSGLTIAANAYVGWQVLQGQMSLGTFTLVVSYTLQLNSVLNSLLESIRDWQQIEMDFDRLELFFLMKPRITKITPPQPVPAEVKEIQLKHISFSYPDLFTEEREYLEYVTKRTENYIKRFRMHYYRHELADWKKLLEPNQNKPQVLKNVNLTLKKGQITALLGRNGAGKTTLTQLLMHQYEPTGGQIELNQTALPAFDQEALLRLFSVLPQRPFVLYRFSVRENLTLGCRTLPNDDELWQVLDQVQLKSVITDLPQGLDTVLGENHRLSGGQEQLLTVARVLLQKRPIIIFDEGMNQLDIEKETAVMSLLSQLAKSSIVLFITHRITTARKADQIFMLDQGEIAETGTHAQLLKTNGLYAAFWKLQVIE